MDQRDLELLEFHKIREILAGFTSFSASRQLALDLLPLADEEEVDLRLRQSAEARRLLSLSPDINIGEVYDIRDAVAMASRGKVLEPSTLLTIRNTLEAARKLRRQVTNLSDDLPLLTAMAGDLIELDQLQRDIGNCISPTGELMDTASPRLASVRHRMREVRQQLLTHLEAIVRSPRRQKIIQEPIITEREGRYVIPIKVEWRREIKGIVHDVSNTGATLFIEPWTTLDMGNEMRELVMEEKHEIDRILATLSSTVGAHESEICSNIELIAEIDLALAKARYAGEAGAIEPDIVAPDREAASDGDGQGGVLRLVEARHPLLAKKAVPLSIEIGREFSALVITGPNTGGKTVALKTIGLLSIMARAGLPIPARSESSIPLFDAVFADIGDEQSIEHTLSTFSWHIGNIVRIINTATPRSLVLLDELGTNTDPGEGSALARSILLHFAAQRTMTVATTHYTELKALAHSTKGLQNAALDVDPTTMTPTYHLTVGIPGGSNALTTASRLGLPEQIITRARDMLTRGTQELDALLTHLMTEQQSAESLRRSLDKERTEAEQRNKELGTRLRQLEEDRGRILRDTRDQIVREASELRKELREAESQLRKERSRERIEQAKKALADAQGQLDSGVWRSRPTAEAGDAAAQAGSIATGDTVWLLEAASPATVLAVHEERGLVEVLVGKAKMTLSLNSVEKRMPTTAGTARKPGRITSGPGTRTVSLELDLRGKRADEVELALDDYLDSASLANLSQVRIIHGYGTGTVRQIVRDMLASHPLVLSFRPGEQGEGGDGVTIVSM
ncbi:MAG: endonuclease MutS2 [Dehalococcoidia bacterium]|nr:endonuclease MutS2 [Dehalococcoidia bacterium]